MAERKLLVVMPNQNQQLITVGDGGRFHDPSLVLWDERNDGPFPDNLIPSIGGLVRSKDTLVVDNRLLREQQLRIQVTLDAETAAMQREIDFRTLLIPLRDKSGALTAAEMSAAVKALIARALII